jgi:hypothetical protein
MEINYAFGDLCQILIVMLSVVMLSVIMLSVIMLSVVMLSVATFLFVSVNISRVAMLNVVMLIVMMLSQVFYHTGVCVHTQLQEYFVRVVTYSSKMVKGLLARVNQSRIIQFIQFSHCRNLMNICWTNAIKF